MTTKSELVGLIEQKEAIEQKIEAAQTELGLDAKGVKLLRKAIAAKEAAEKTLAAMMGIDPTTAAKIEPEPVVEPEPETAPGKNGKKED